MVRENLNVGFCSVLFVKNGAAFSFALFCAKCLCGCFSGGRGVQVRARFVVSAIIPAVESMMATVPCAHLARLSLPCVTNMCVCVRALSHTCLKCVYVWVGWRADVVGVIMDMDADHSPESSVILFFGRTAFILSVCGHQHISHCAAGRR